TRVRSVSGVGLSIVYVEFDWGSDIYRNRQQIAERLNLVREQLPEGIVPQLGPISSIMGETLLLALPIDPARASPMQVREDGEWAIYRTRHRIAVRLILGRDQLPEGIVPPLGPISSIMGVILLLALPIDPARASPMQVREYADWVMRPRLLTSPGIAQVISIGGEVRQYRVEIDPAQLKALAVEREGVDAALRDFGANTSGGFLEAQGREYLI